VHEDETQCSALRCGLSWVWRKFKKTKSKRCNNYIWYEGKVTVKNCVRLVRCQYSFIIIAVYTNTIHFVTLYKEMGIVKSVCSFTTCFGLIGHPQMYSHMHTEPKNFLLK
jgi:hypothetical protein